LTYTDSTTVSEFLQTDITTTSTPSLDTVNDWIAWADTEVDTATGRTFSEQTGTDIVVASNGGRDFWLPKEYVPLVSITKLEINTGSDFDTNWVEKTEGSDFIIVDLVSGHIKFSPNITVLKQNFAVRVTIQYGYSSAPNNIKELATKIVAKQFVTSVISSVSIETNEFIRVGPITISPGSGDSVKYVKGLTEDIDRLKKSVGTFKTYIY